MLPPLRSLLYILILIGLPCFAGAEQPRAFFFTVYNTFTGLPSDQVNSVIQDNQGYLWIGTTDGLVRYDGIRYKTFRHADNNRKTLPSNPVLQVLLHTDGNVWVLLADGKLGLFNTRTLDFQEAGIIAKDDRGLRMGPKHLTRDEFGNIFLLVRGHELLKWDPENRLFEPIYDFIPLDKSLQVHEFAHQPGTQKYWMTVNLHGTLIYDRKTGKTSYAGHNEGQEPFIDAYPQIKDATRYTFDRKGRVWFTNWGGGFPYVHSFDLRKGTKLLDHFEYILTLKTYNEVGGFFEQTDGTMWVMGVKTFSYFDEKTNAFRLMPAEMSSSGKLDFSETSCMYEDREHNVWVGSRINGLYRFNPSLQYFKNVRVNSRVSNRQADGNVMSFIRDRDGSFLTSAWGDGIYRYDSQFNPIPLRIRGIPDDNHFALWSMFPSRDGRTIWMSAQPGIYAYDMEKRQARFYNPAKLENRTIRQVVEDKHGRLWLGMQSLGLFFWTQGADGQWLESGISRHPGISRTFINHIVAGRDGTIWVSTPSDGVYAINPDTDSIRYHFHRNAEAPFQLPEDGVSSVVPYDDSLVVITTSASVFLFNSRAQKLTPVGNPDFISGFIAASQKDRQGYIWISTTSALYRVNIFKSLFLRFDKEDGINHDNFILAASYQSNDGRLFFGSEGSFIVFNPADIRVQKQVGNVSISDIKVMNQSLSLDSVMRLPQLSLEYRSNSLVVDFTPLSFANPPLVQYRLAGLEKTWNVADRKNQAVYSFLPPGSYTLEFNIVDEERIVHPSDLKIRIKVEPPFWKSWWFYSLAGLLTMAMLFWIDRMRLQRIRDKQLMRASIAGQLHHDVQTTLQNINVLSEIAAMKSASKPEEAARYIKDIQKKSRDMVMSMKDVLWSIDPSNDSMAKMIERMHEVADAMKSRYQVRVSIQTGSSVPGLTLDMQARLRLITLYKQMITNLSEALPDGAILVQVDQSRPFLQLKMYAHGAGRLPGGNWLEQRMAGIRKLAAESSSAVDMQVDASGVAMMLEMKI